MEFASFSHRELLFTGPDGLILSTDDYFADTDGYRYNAEHLGAAHEWNQNRGVVSVNICLSILVCVIHAIQYQGMWNGWNVKCVQFILFLIVILFF